MFVTRLCVALLMFALTGCTAVEDLKVRLRGETPHEDYMHSLDSAGLLHTALGQDWLAAAQAALAQPLTTTLPVQETGYLDPAQPSAVAISVQLERGEHISIVADLQPATDAQLFVDVYRVDPDGDAPRHVAAADSGQRVVEYEPSRTGDYIVRIQPELLRGGRYTLTVRTSPALSFPVHGVSARAVASIFGDPRDGGARDHHGIDIFAPRGTPVLAAANGYVNRVQETPRGGKVVWLRDEQRGLSIYYAHLDEQLVSSGMRVQIGDTLGRVGNTGNARTTPPHLHFGVYRRGEGPLDPLPFVRPRDTTVARLRADSTLFGEWARTRSPYELGERRLAADTPLRIRGAAGNRYRAQLPDGTLLWINADDVERAATAVATERVAATCAVRAEPTTTSAVKTELAAAQHVAILGSFQDFRLVATDSVRGWTDCV